MRRRAGLSASFVDELGGGTLLDALARWDEVAAALAGWSPAAGAPDMVADARLVALLTYPGKVLCSGANYYCHAAEMGVAGPGSRRRAVLLSQAAGHKRHRHW